MVAILRLTACILTVAGTTLVSAVAGPFDAYVGKYKGKGIERGSDGSTYRFTQTVKLENSTQRLTTTLPGVATAHEVIRFRRNGTISGSGSVNLYGNYVTWVVTGTWKQEGNLIKGRNVTTYQDGSTLAARYVHKFEDGLLKMNARGYSSSDGTSYTSTYTGELVETATLDAN